VTPWRVGHSDKQYRGAQERQYVLYLSKLLALLSGGVTADGTSTVTVGLLFCPLCLEGMVEESNVVEDEEESYLEPNWTGR
jgi:hypothetical protein